MSQKFRRVSLFPVVALMVAGALSGCGGSETATVQPLALDQRPVSAEELGGAKVDGPVKTSDLEEFAKDHGKKVSELEATGMVAGASQNFKLNGPGTSFSIVAQHETDEQAAAEAKRLYETNSKPEKGGPTITPLEVAGIPGARGSLLSGEQDGMKFSGYEITFSDGPFVYELFAIGSVDEVSAEVGTQAAISQYERVKGRPAA